jgi:LacI family transcriptional regulator
MPKGLSLEDIARLSGVSRSTVSRVINDRPYVSPESRDRVLRIIREHNFRPNLTARALASRRSKVIGILIPHDVSDLFTEPFFPILIKGITLVSNQLGYSVTLWLATVSGEQSEFYATAFNESVIDGLVIASATFDMTCLNWLSTLTKPVVFVGATPPSMANSCHVDVDNRQGALLATYHLVEQGCRRIGMIEGRPQIVNDNRRQGYMDALRVAGLPVDSALMIPNGQYTESSGYACMQTLLARGVDGVFAANDMMALGAMRAIREANLRVPEDIAVVGFDDLPFAALTTPPLTTVRQPVSQLGEEATRLLIQLLEGDGAVPPGKTLPVELQIRGTTVRKIAQAG